MDDPLFALVSLRQAELRTEAERARLARAARKEWSLPRLPAVRLHRRTAPECATC